MLTEAIDLVIMNSFDYIFIIHMVDIKLQQNVAANRDSTTPSCPALFVYTVKDKKIYKIIFKVVHDIPFPKKKEDLRKDGLPV
jgi:hypothetical protein